MTNSRAIIDAPGPMPGETNFPRSICRARVRAPGAGKVFLSTGRLDSNLKEEHMLPFRKHVFVCTNSKPDDDGCCAARGSEEVLQKFRAEIAGRKLQGEIHVTPCGSLALRPRPNMVVHPDGTWYSGVTVTTSRKSSNSIWSAAKSSNGSPGSTTTSCTRRLPRTGPSPKPSERANSRSRVSLDGGVTESISNQAPAGRAIGNGSFARRTQALSCFVKPILG